MLLLFFAPLSLTISYSLTNNVLTISGEGEILQYGIRSRGDYTKHVEVIIEEGPTSIAESSFEGCSSLKKITISKTVQSITRPFRGCKSLSTIIVDEENEYFYSENDLLISKTTDRKELIRAPTNRKIIEVPEGIKIIRKDVFSTNYAFQAEEVVIANSVETIEYHGFHEVKIYRIKFKDNPKITKLNGFQWSTFTSFMLPKSSIEISGSCFEGSTIGSITFQETSILSTLKSSSFRLTNIKSITFPESLERIESNAFYQNTYIQTLTFGSKLSNIDSTAFTGCTSLTQINIAETNTYFTTSDNVLMTSDHTQIIFLFGKIEILNIDEHVSSIASMLLQNQKTLTTLTVNAENEHFSSYNNVLYNKNFTQLIAVCGGLEDVEAHESVVSLASSCCFGCTNLKTFTFKFTDSTCKCTTIGATSFQSSGIVSFTLPDSVTTLSDNAFNSCKSIEKFKINENSQLKTLGQSVFVSSSLENIIIPKEVTEISSQCFESSSIKHVSFLGLSKCNKISGRAFRLSSLEIIEIPSQVTIIENSAFKDCKNLKTIEFIGVSMLNTIIDSAFEGCVSLETIDIPSSCQNINSRAFFGCSLLSHVTNNANNISAASFENCISLTNFTFSSTISSLDAGIFRGCSKLSMFYIESGNPKLKTKDGVVFSYDETTLVLFPPGVSEAVITRSTLDISERAFAYSTTLRNVLFLSSCPITTIHPFTFAECSSLSSITFPSNLAVISSYCFSQCINIIRVSFPSSLVAIESNAFSGCSQLSYIEYCGTNKIDDFGGFDQSSTKLKTAYVTVLYPHNFFSGISAQRALSDSCTLLPEKLSQRTCRQRTYFVSNLHFTFFLPISL